MRGMTNQNIAAESARENARQSDGKFGTQPAAEAEIDLDETAAPEQPAAEKTRAEFAADHVAAMRAEGYDEKQIGLASATTMLQGTLEAGKQLTDLARQLNTGHGENGSIHAAGMLIAMAHHRQATEEMLTASSEDYERILTEAANKVRTSGWGGFTAFRNPGGELVADSLDQLAAAAGGFTCAGVQPVNLAEERAKADTDPQDVAADERG